MGILVAIAASTLSIFIVLKRVSLIGDGLAHTAFGGLSLGYYIGVSIGYYSTILPLWVAAVVVVLGSIGITKTMRSRNIAGDAAVAVFLQFGLASGIVLLYLARGFGFNIESLLFGSILTVSLLQIEIAGVVLVCTLALVFIFYKELVYTTFDELQARAAGIRTWIFDYMIGILAGITVVASIPIVGVLLISAMLVLPALTSIQFARSFRQTLILSPIFGILSVILGVILSIILDSASGATIVLVGLLVFAISAGTRRFRKPGMVAHKLSDRLTRR